MPYDAIMRCQTKAIARSVNDRRQISVDCGELIEVLGCVESRMDGMCKVRRLRDGETGYMPGAALAEDAWRMLRKGMFCVYHLMSRVCVLTWEVSVQQDRLRRTTLSESEYDDDEEDGSASGKES